MQIVISVITCIYNQDAELFYQCAESVKAQKLPVEWIVIDDGSDTNYIKPYHEVLSNFNNYHHLVFHTLSTNSGLSIARNAAIDIAKGDWILVLDSDDMLVSDVSVIINAVPVTYSLLCFSVDFLKESSRVEHRCSSIWQEQYYKHGLTPLDPFLWFDFYYHGIIARSTLIRSINGYDSCLAIGEDQDILLRACQSLLVNEVGFIEETGYVYRDNPNGLCRTRWKDVEHNYIKTMIEGANQRGLITNDCKFKGTVNINGADIDEYIYKINGQWITWNELNQNPSTLQIIN